MLNACRSYQPLQLLKHGQLKASLIAYVFKKAKQVHKHLARAAALLVQREADLERRRRPAVCVLSIHCDQFHKLSCVLLPVLYYVQFFFLVAPLNVHRIQ